MANHKWDIHITFSKSRGTLWKGERALWKSHRTGWSVAECCLLGIWSRLDGDTLEFAVAVIIIRDWTSRHAVMEWGWTYEPQPSLRIYR